MAGKRKGARRGAGTGKQAPHESLSRDTRCEAVFGPVRAGERPWRCSLRAGHDGVHEVQLVAGYFRWLITALVLALAACGDNLEPAAAPDAAVDAAPPPDASRVVAVGVTDQGGGELARVTLPITLVAEWCAAELDVDAGGAHVRVEFHAGAAAEPVTHTFTVAGVYRAFGEAQGGAVTCRSVVP